MLVDKACPWGNLRGKLTLTPEEALEQFGFIMKEGAKGVIFRQYTILLPGNIKEKRTFISNYNPPSNPQTPRQQGNRSKMALAVADWKFHLTPEERAEWRRKANKLHMSGFNLHNREYLRTH